jgi:hypothetical protein
MPMGFKISSPALFSSLNQEWTCTNKSLNISGFYIYLMGKEKT